MKLEQFLEQEDKKIAEADRLSKELENVWFGILNPRWWKVKDRLHAVVKSFSLCDENYNLNLPKDLT